MSSFDFIIDDIRFSYSSLNTYATCPYSFKMNYVDKLTPKADNFFGQYGTLIHQTMNQFFLGNLDEYELSQYYRDNYGLVVTCHAPPYPAGMEERYQEAGLVFFDNFEFDMKGYKVLLNEEKIDFDFEDGIKFTGKPDLVLYNENTGKFVLYDYKTSAPFRIDKRNGNEIIDEKKMEGYYTQMYIYAYMLRNAKFIPLDEIVLWFTRPNRKEVIKWKKKEEDSAIRWLRRVVKKIRKDENFMYDNSNPYYCNNLCSVREFCEFR